MNYVFNSGDFKFQTVREILLENPIAIIEMSKTIDFDDDVINRLNIPKKSNLNVNGMLTLNKYALEDIEELNNLDDNECEMMVSKYQAFIDVINREIDEI